MNQEIQEALNRINKEMTMAPLSNQELVELEKAFGYFIYQIKQMKSLKVA